MRDYSHFNPGTAAAFERSDAAHRNGDHAEAAREFAHGLALASPEERQRIEAAVRRTTR
ncbi:hypothetical protein GCM10010420_07320 [Streptomyces glaucosporus]|uniref:Tetratricopeptide repeat protein n=1 Tax=Streptomyces glaucosporus TaxID=284044 RepID=A0ABN3HSE0_9ACTN